jgi:hypothetical protein
MGTKFAVSEISLKEQDFPSRRFPAEYASDNIVSFLQKFLLKKEATPGYESAGGVGTGKCL